ncbi:MAG TPA: tripartite tricarboxylate transporter TctB family protein [Hyphomicrobiaceae bacterium]|jgi:putative tricarboxylic transport membrane protein|nr:tripartite tricarboxylate transporter TctB family protein [Hyphomicrobiaceae bacterium]
MVKAPQDFWSGLAFLGAGLFISISAWGYPAGTAARMSHGYVPMLLGYALCAVGAASVVRSFLVHGAPVSRIALRPMLPLAAVIAFALLLHPAGLVVATFALIVISVMAADRFRPLDILILSALLIPFNWIIFVRALGLPLPLLPWG